MQPPFAGDRLKSERASEKDGYSRLLILDPPLTQTDHPTAVRPYVELYIRPIVWIARLP